MSEPTATGIDRTVADAVEKYGKIMTNRELCEFARITLATTARWRKKGTGPQPLRVGDRTIRYDTAEAVRWVMESGNPDLRGRQKALEAEVRAMQNAKSPYEAGVKAALDLCTFAQYVYAVGKTVGDMPLFNVEEVDDALADLADQVALARSEIAVVRAAAHSGNPEVHSTVVIDAEEKPEEDED